MPIVDEYIKNNKHLPIKQMAKNLGLDESYLERLIKSRGYNGSKNNQKFDTSKDEIIALINLINLRKTGWAVSVAKERIKYLENQKRTSIYN